jgi:uncharacterized protein
MDNQQPTVRPEQYYTLDFQPTGVFLQLTPECYANPELKKPVLDSLSGRGLSDLNLPSIEEMFANKTAEARPVAPPQPQPIDGKVDARLSDDKKFVLIKVTPPMGKGRQATMDDLLKALTDVNAGDFYLDHERAQEILTSFKIRDFVPVAERRDGHVEVTVSKDKSEAVMMLTSAFGGAPVSFEDVVIALKGAGIKYGIKKDNILKMLREKIYNQPVIIAAGDKTVDGENARIEFYFDTKFKRPKPSVADDGSIDYRELSLYEKIKAGDPVARKIPRSEGSPGINVFGEKVAPRIGKDLPYPGGLNTKPDKDDPNLVIAALDGQPKFQSNRVHVYPLIEIFGNVDYSTGNIDFTGSVNIRGNVLTGFTVKAGGDVTVGGCVEGARVESGGNVVVRQGIVGMDAGFVLARGNVSAKHIDKATIYAEGNVYVDETIMYSRVSSSGEVVVSGAKGLIIGGITRASKFVHANQIGAAINPVTVIEVGGSPSFRQELEDLENEMAAAEEAVLNQEKSLKSIEKNKEQTQSDAASRERHLRLSRDHFALVSRLRAYRERKESLEEKLTRMSGHSIRVYVRNRVYPNTKISIKTALWICKEPMDFVTFYERDGEVQFLPYEKPGTVTS